ASAGPRHKPLCGARARPTVEPRALPPTVGRHRVAAHREQHLPPRGAAPGGLVMDDTTGIDKLVDIMSARKAASKLNTEDAIALRFAQDKARSLRYVHKWGRWFHYSGTRWEEDTTLLAFDLARDLCRKVAQQTRTKKLESAKTVAAVLQLARADRRLAATAQQWDPDPWLLNTPRGAVDLKTGELRPHRLEDYCTKMTTVAPGADCPLWLQTLRYVFGGDEDLV